MASEAHVLFRLGPQAFAITLGAVKDIARAPIITPVPHAPTSLRGLCVMREELAPVLDVRARLGFKPLNKIGTVLLVEQDGERVALLVDRVEEVLHLPVLPPQVTARDPLWQLVVAGIIHRAGDTVVVLDVDGLLSVEA